MPLGREIWGYENYLICYSIFISMKLPYGKPFLCVKFAARPLSREITMSQAYQNMCAGMYKVMYICDFFFILECSVSKLS